MPDNTREPRAAKKEAAQQEEAAGQAKDITPLVCTLLSKMMIKDDSPLHEVGITVPAKGDQPAKFVTLNDLVREYKTVEDLQLLHEIAVDDEFKLKKVKENDPLYATIAQTMHNAYWNLMREELAEDPPNKDRAINLLMDIRLAFRSLLEGNNDRALRAIEQQLDPARVREVIEQDLSAALDYTKFIIEVMGMACATARDEQVKALAKETDLVDRLRGIMELLELMQLDMANFVLDLARYELVKHSIDYERKMFYEQLQLGHPLSCRVTEDWLRRAYNRYMSVNPPRSRRRAAAAAAGPSTGSDQPAQPDAVDVPAVLQFAYGELFDPNLAVMIPEVFNLDVERVKKMRSEMLRLAVCAACVYIATQGETPLAETSRQSLADVLMVLVEDCSTVDEIKQMLENMWLMMGSCLSGRVTAEQDAAFKIQVLTLGDNRSQVYVFLLSKITLYLHAVASSPDGEATIPVAFKDYDKQLIKLGKVYRKVIRQNRAVHDDFYKQTFAKLARDYRF